MSTCSVLPHAAIKDNSRVLPSFRVVLQREGPLSQQTSTLAEHVVLSVRRQCVSPGRNEDPVSHRLTYRIGGGRIVGRIAN